jgi:hypothetical protein
LWKEQLVGANDQAYIQAFGEYDLTYLKDLIDLIMAEFDRVQEKTLHRNDSKREINTCFKIYAILAGHIPI